MQVDGSGTAAGVKEKPPTIENDCCPATELFAKFRKSKTSPAETPTENVPDEFDEDVSESRV